LLDILAPGPVVLGGFSFGALMAFELLRRLRARGFEVPLVVSLDGYAPGYPELLPAPQRIWAHLRQVALTRGDERREYLRDRYDHLRHRMWRWLRQEHRLSERSSSMTPEMRRRFAKTWRVNSEAARRYRPAPVDGAAMLLIRAERAARQVGFARLDEVNGWAPFVGNRISVVTVSGDHAHILGDANQHRIVDAIRRHLPSGWTDARG
jgi:thioesterase domain-containing protein